ncbi:MAG: helix-turn-helix transcriptional regulator [Acidimicrobiia bacterium]
MALKDFNTTEEVAEYLSVSVNTVRKWRADGSGPRGLRLGRVVRYSRADVEHWLAERAGDDAA